MRYFFLVIIVVLADNIKSQNYIWPTNASPYLSSSFCEYRPDHYHAAIDIKTWNREGYPCYAVEDGHIERIKLSPFGAGKALYIRLKDSRKAVYFHLQKFNKKLEQKVREIQLANKSYSIEWWPKNWTVKKGEIIGYTGQTGIGVPHLHFEIRDAHDNPLNPLRFYKSVKDNIRPVLRELIVIPQNENSVVNNSFIPRKYGLTYIRNGVYVIKEPVYADGIIGLAIEGFDQANDVSNKLSFYKQEMDVGGKLHFQKAYDRMSFSSTRMVDLDIYYPEKRSSNKRFNTLFIEEQNALGFYNRNLGSGLIYIQNEKVPVEIRISDFAGNTSIVKCKIIPQSQSAKIVSTDREQPASVFLKVNIPDSLKELQFFSGTSLQDLEKINYYEIVEKNFADSNANFLIKLRPLRFGDNLIQSVVENQQGVVSQTSTWLKNKKKTNVLFNSRLMGKYLYLSFDNIEQCKTLNLEFIQNTNSKLVNIKVENGRAEYVFPARYLYKDVTQLVVKQREETYLDTVLVINKMLPGKMSVHTFFNDSMQVKTTNHSVYDTLLFRVEKTAKPGLVDKVPVFGSAYTIDNGNRALDRRVFIALKRDSSFYIPRQCAIYTIDDDELDFLGGDYNPNTGFISTQVHSFGSYFIVADTVAPTIDIIQPKVDATYKKMPVIFFKIEEDLSKIGTDENIKILLDNQFIVAEWDPERNLVSGRVHFKLQAGQHSVHLNVRDQAGNITEKEVSFFIQ